MSVFQQLAAQQMTPQDAMAQMRQDPSAMLGRAGYSVPQGMKNPQEIVQHLMRSGQLSNTRLGQLMQMAGMK